MEWRRYTLINLAACCVWPILASCRKPASTQSSPAPTVETAASSVPATTEIKKVEFKVPSDDELRKSLSELQWKVTRENGTERSFSNEYWNTHEIGLYVCRISGKPLFHSKDKFDSGTGWPSFTQPIDISELEFKEAQTLFLGMQTEVRAKFANSHLGHVFDDGPAPTGKRYCMNSAALRFIPKSKLKDEGYEDYLALFEGRPQ